MRAQQRQRLPQLLRSRPPLAAADAPAQRLARRRHVVPAGVWTVALADVSPSVGADAGSIAAGVATAAALPASRAAAAAATAAAAAAVTVARVIAAVACANVSCCIDLLAAEGAARQATAIGIGGGDIASCLILVLRACRGCTLKAVSSQDGILLTMVASVLHSLAQDHPSSYICIVFTVSFE